MHFLLLCWVSIYWVSLWWVSLCWVLWHLFPPFEVSIVGFPIEEKAGGHDDCGLFWKNLKVSLLGRFLSPNVQYDAISKFLSGRKYNNLRNVIVFCKHFGKNCFRQIFNFQIASNCTIGLKNQTCKWTLRQKSIWTKFTSHIKVWHWRKAPEVFKKFLGSF